MTGLNEDEDFPEDTDLAIRNCVWGFKCDKTWDSLSNTNNSHIRFCGKCQKEVHRCDDDASLVQSIALNRCIAIDPATYVGRFDGGDCLILGSIVYDEKKDDA